MWILEKIIPKYQVKYVYGVGFCVLVRRGVRRWCYLKYNDAKGHYHGEYLIFETKGSAEQYAKKHTKGDYTEWVSQSSH
mgnify:CR=1 FL=1